MIPLLAYLKVGKADPNQIFQVTGTLDAKEKLEKKRPGRFFKTHEVKLMAGTTYRIELDSSQFDAYLILEDGKGTKLAEDDDSGGNTDAKIVFTPNADGVYRVIATTCDVDQKGSYTLTVTKQDKN